MARRGFRIAGVMADTMELRRPMRRKNTAALALRVIAERI